MAEQDVALLLSLSSCQLWCEQGMGRAWNWAVTCGGVGVMELGCGAKPACRDRRVLAAAHSRNGGLWIVRPVLAPVLMQRHRQLQAALHGAEAALNGFCTISLLSPQKLWCS